MERLKVKKPLCLIILDGWGIRKETEGNAIKLASTPNMDNYSSVYPNTLLNSSGEAVGLPEGQMGNSEVGHLNIGAGRIVYQELTRITKSIKDGEFFTNEVILSAVRNVKRNDSCLHVMGLVSDGGVHSHIDHLKAIVDLAKKNNIKKFYIHAFLDGRDVPPTSGIDYIKELDSYLEEKGIGYIASVSGRYYAMDRDNRWDRVKIAYDALVYRKGHIFGSAEELVEKSYAEGIFDEFVEPALVKVDDEDFARIKDGDSLLFFNFRPDRARQITKSFIAENFTDFDRGDFPPEVFFVCMTQYNKDFSAPVAFPPARITNTLGQVLAANNMKQLRIAETEKYAHVTFFFNGGIEKPNPGEERILIPSSKVATYDLKPEMSALEVTDTVIKKIEENIFDVIIMNYANPDMVGHTGFLNAAIKAVETVDACLGRVIEKLKSTGGLGIITADHGNAEEMIDCVKKCAITAHSTSKVPFILCSNEFSINTSADNALCDIAPTILYLLNIEKPDEMTGECLIKI
ncbi:MAG: 2,3-bisphosphoglycerate-independent phosphoglycerate mutase [Actinobacteria bacterium]|nr:2,3-bisphosphoglycerate-independent phosphoglycerate mutase [Actinomycetota bacterium]